MKLKKILNLIDAHNPVIRANISLIIANNTVKGAKMKALKNWAMVNLASPSLAPVDNGALAPADFQTYRRAKPFQ